MAKPLPEEIKSIYAPLKQDQQLVITRQDVLAVLGCFGFIYLVFVAISV